MSSVQTHAMRRYEGEQPCRNLWSLLLAATTYQRTVRLLTAALQRRAITLFATIDHGEGARAAGLRLPDEVVRVFGNPTAGTPVMQADPRAGIDLPLRILVWSRNGETQLAFRDPQLMAEDFSLVGQTGILAKLRSVLDQLVAEVTQ